MRANSNLPRDLSPRIRTNSNFRHSSEFKSSSRSLPLAFERIRISRVINPPHSSKFESFRDQNLVYSNVRRDHSPAFELIRISHAITFPYSNVQSNVFLQHSVEFQSPCAITSSNIRANSNHCVQFLPHALEWKRISRAINPPHSSEFESLRDRSRGISPAQSLSRIRANSNLLRDFSLPHSNHRARLQTPVFEWIQTIAHDLSLSLSLSTACEWIRLFCDQFLVERIRISREVERIRIFNSNYASRIVEEAANVH